MLRMLRVATVVAALSVGTAVAVAPGGASPAEAQAYRGPDLVVVSLGVVKANGVGSCWDTASPTLAVRVRNLGYYKSEPGAYVSLQAKLIGKAGGMSGVIVLPSIAPGATMTVTDQWTVNSDMMTTASRWTGSVFSANDKHHENDAMGPVLLGPCSALISPFPGS